MDKLNKILTLYDRLELEIIELYRSNLVVDIKDISKWEAYQLNQLNKTRRKLAQLIAKYQNEIKSESGKTIFKEYEKAADKEMQRLLKK